MCNGTPVLSLTNTHESHVFFLVKKKQIYQKKEIRILLFEIYLTHAYEKFNDTKPCFFKLIHSYPRPARPCCLPRPTMSYRYFTLLRFFNHPPHIRLCLISIIHLNSRPFSIFSWTLIITTMQSPLPIKKKKTCTL